tara:strand:- start:154 stop:399 length:246 start_codon:yes stop_codon:yes gene_type:complete
MTQKYIDELDEVLEKVSLQKENAELKLKGVEESLSDTKLNPYGVTSIDFSERQELIEDILKMEGTLMGLKLAKETYSEIAI